MRVVWKADDSVVEPMANSSRFVLPTTIAPADCSFSTTVAEYGGTKLSRILLDAVVRRPRVQRLSLRATGIPARGGSAFSSPDLTASVTILSTFSAATRAPSASTVINAPMAPSRASMRFRAASTMSAAVTWP